VGAEEWVIVVLVIGARLLLPLLIPYFPIVGVVSCLVLDAVDQTIFQQFPAIPLEGYQSYDKALDIYYLTITYLSTFRNWTNAPAFRMSQGLFYYRLVGVVAFELSGARALLLIFPNTFEYFFIFYELVRMHWSTARLSKKIVVVTAIFIWVVIKIPQEWWIHIAQLDVTDEISAHPWVLVPIIVVSAIVLVTAWWWVTRKAPPGDHGIMLRADPLSPELKGAELYRLARAGSRVFSWVLAEKIILIGFVSVIFVSMLPGLDAQPLQVVWSVAVFVALNTAVSHWLARRGRGWSTVAIEFAAMTVINLGIVVGVELVERVLRVGGYHVPPLATLFFIFLITLIIVLYDRFRTVRVVRRLEGPMTTR